jgi:predicted transcriptional regulator
MRAKVGSATKIVDRLIGSDEDLRNLVDQATLNARVAQLIHDARIASGLTQAQLADLIGTTQSVIARLEDADYEDHSLSMLRRIAEALHQRLDIRFVRAEVR